MDPLTSRSPAGNGPDSRGFLAASRVIDHNDPAVQEKARDLAVGSDDVTALAERYFLFVRDEIRHSADVSQNPVTIRASDVLKYRTGFCYAKSHLLAALLRANGIPAGLCYQRLTFDRIGRPFALHGLNAVCLPAHGWYRIDARGNRPGIDARFAPPPNISRMSPASQARETCRESLQSRCRRSWMCLCGVRPSAKSWRTRPTGKFPEPER